jgi:hypothetical protein
MAARSSHAALYARVRVLEAKFKASLRPAGDEVDCKATEEVCKLIMEHFMFVPECEAIVAIVRDKVKAIHGGRGGPGDGARGVPEARVQGGPGQGHRDGAHHGQREEGHRGGLQAQDSGGHEARVQGGPRRVHREDDNQGGLQAHGQEGRGAGRRSGGRVANEKLVVKKAAEQAAEVEAAKAKTHREQVEEGLAAAKVKVDAEMFAKASAAEELAAKEEMEKSIAETAALGDAEWLELFEYCLMTGRVVEADLEQGNPRRHQVWLAKQAKQAEAETAEVKPQGSTVAEAAAVVLTAGKATKQKHGEAAAKEQGVEEQAAKKAKVNRFDAVDMELEALAQRIDSMPSATEARDWYSRRWR